MKPILKDPWYKETPTWDSLFTNEIAEFVYSDCKWAEVTKTSNSISTDIGRYRKLLLRMNITNVKVRQFRNKIILCKEKDD